MKRRLPMISVAVVMVICLVAVSVLAVASGASGGAVAFSVNGTKVSQETVDRELEWLAGNRGIAANVQQQGGTLSNSDGSITSPVTASWLTQRIQVELLREQAAKHNVTISAAKRKTLDQQAAKRYPHAPESARRIIVDGNAYLEALGISTQQQQSELFTAALRGADIHVDPRYGRWAGARGVCPPTGCGAVPGAGG